MSENWTHFHFNLLQVDMSTLRAIETELKDNGVYFDTGCWMQPEGPREWHTDWSLEGPMSVEELAKHLDDKEIPYKMVSVAKVD
tara:strand:+ start:784 stop:1035 length:252 start_codon:yes stop_codon:yes gene_type:complete